MSQILRKNLSQRGERMPNYKNPAVFNQLPNDTNFDTIHWPGQLAPFSGIYKCQSCGFECVSTKNHPLPPERACSAHSVEWRGHSGAVSWRLVAAAIHVSANA
jgi:hypothetical protein